MAITPEYADVLNTTVAEKLNETRKAQARTPLHGMDTDLSRRAPQPPGVGGMSDERRAKLNVARDSSKNLNVAAIGIGQGSLQSLRDTYNMFTRDIRLPSTVISPGLLQSYYTNNRKAIRKATNQYMANLTGIRGDVMASYLNMKKTTNKYLKGALG